MCELKYTFELLSLVVVAAAQVLTEKLYAKHFANVENRNVSEIETI